MGDIEMSDAGRVRVHRPLIPLDQRVTFVRLPPPPPERDLYPTLKSLQRTLENLTLLEVPPPPQHPPPLCLYEMGVNRGGRSTSKTKPKV
jgi:hypothetical protein